jgi:hypothetical protein
MTPLNDPARFRESQDTTVPIQVTSSVAMVSVYHTPEHFPGGDRSYDTYYMCCHTCGNCGRRHSGPEPALADATDHILNAHPIQGVTP